MKSSWIYQVGPTSNDSHPYVKQRWHREKSVSWWRQKLELLSYKPKYAKDCQQTLEARREARRDSPLEPPEGTNPADNLFSDFRPPEQWENKVLLFEVTQFAVFCYRGPRKLILTPGRGHGVLGIVQAAGFEQLPATVFVCLCVFCFGLFVLAWHRGRMHHHSPRRLLETEEIEPKSI